MLDGNFVELRQLGQSGVVDASRLAALVAGGDVNAGIAAAGIAAENNSLGMIRKAWKLGKLLVEKDDRHTPDDVKQLISSLEDLAQLYGNVSH